MKNSLVTIVAAVFIFFIITGVFYLRFYTFQKTKESNLLKPSTQKKSLSVGSIQNTSSQMNSLNINSMREKEYPGSPIVIEENLSQGQGFNQYIASYLSDGLKIYGLLTVPIGTMPQGGWPVILFNHGYIEPSQYSTINSYAVMVDPLASSGYIVFKPDYRGNGKSLGTPQQVYVSPSYITDSMNALSSIINFKEANPNKIGVFGHSMGGNITLHELEITHKIKAAEIMAGVVGNETSIISWWRERISDKSIVGNDLMTSYSIEQMLNQHETPQLNPTYWNAIDPTLFLSSVDVPVQIQVGSQDDEVPVEFSTTLFNSLKKDGKTVFFNEYTGADHNLEPYTQDAMNATIAFFNIYLK